MGEGFEDALRRRADLLREAMAIAGEQGDPWAVAVCTVDLQDVRRLGRERGLDLAPVTVPVLGPGGAGPRPLLRQVAAQPAVSAPRAEDLPAAGADR
jgi:hypothetical protein